MVDFGVGGVDVFLLHALGGGVELATTEGNHLAADVKPGEDSTAGKTVVDAALTANGESGLLKKLVLEALAAGLATHRVATGEGKAQLKLLDDVVADAATAEIGTPDGLTVDVVLQYLMEVATSPLVDDEHRLAIRLLTLLLVAELTLLYLYVILPGQPAQRLGIGNLLVLHEKVDGVAALAAGKALAYLTGRRHHERGCRVVVEGTQALVVDTCLTQIDKLTHHIDDVGGIHNLIDGRSVYHLSDILL